MIINSGILLGAIGGFSEQRFLLLFRQIDIKRLEEIIRSATPEDWGRPGELTLRDFLAPLETQMFPRHSIGKFGWAMESVLLPKTEIREAIPDPLIFCYCAILHIYAEIHVVSTGYESLPRSCALLFNGLRHLDFSFRIETAKCLFWMHSLACNPHQRDLDPRVMLSIYGFMLMATCVIDLGDTCVAEINAEAKRRGIPIWQRSTDGESDRLLAKAIRSITGPDGDLSRILQRVSQTVLDPHSGEK